MPDEQPAECQVERHAFTYDCRTCEDDDFIFQRRYIIVLDLERAHALLDPAVAFLYCTFVVVASTAQHRTDYFPSSCCLLLNPSLQPLKRILVEHLGAFDRSWSKTGVLTAACVVTPHGSRDLLCLLCGRDCKTGFSHSDDPLRTRARAMFTPETTTLSFRS